MSERSVRKAYCRIFGHAEGLASQQSAKTIESGEAAGKAAALAALKTKSLGIPASSLQAEIQAGLPLRYQTLCDGLLALHSEQARKPDGYEDMTTDEKKLHDAAGTSILMLSLLSIYD